MIVTNIGFNQYLISIQGSIKC